MALVNKIKIKPLKLHSARKVSGQSKPSNIEKKEKSKSEPNFLIPNLQSGHYQGSFSEGIYLKNEDGKNVHVCSYINFVAYLENDRTGKLSVRAKFVDQQGGIKIATIPHEYFSNANRLIKLLKGHDFCVQNLQAAKKFLPDFYLSHPPELNIRVVNEPGWHSIPKIKLNAYVVNGKVFMPAGASFNIELRDDVNAGYSCKGTEDGWLNNVASLCQGNPLLIFTVCASLLGPMLKLIGFNNIGIHIFGVSIPAQTMCLIVARSIFGDQNFGSCWNATTDANKKTAGSRNHSVLILDENSQCEAKYVSAAVYDLMNGMDINHFRQDSKPKAVADIGMVVISTGEESLQEHQQNGVVKVKLWQLFCMPSVPTNPIKEMIQNLHGEATIHALASRLRAGIEDNYGTIGSTWIQYLVDKQLDLKLTLPAQVQEIADELLASIESDEPSEAQLEVAKNMAAIACAGEVAISNRLMPWPRYSATEAAKVCFKAGTFTNMESKSNSNQSPQSRNISRLNRN